MAADSHHNTSYEGLDELCAITEGKRIAILTGAGVSTDSGIPDYRGKGASKRTPMNISDFLASPQSRKRYWAGAHLGWTSFSHAEPNAGHLAIAAMEQSGIIEGVISQNVDGLHRRAGSSHVVDLHGSLDRVICLDCGQQFDRNNIERKLWESNPWLHSLSEIVLAPDGDVTVTDFDKMVIPECTVCGGILKPDVVFFGEFVPAKVFSSAQSLLKRAEVLVIAGSSLAVNSAVRLVDQARREKKPIAIINRGETKADKKASVKLDASASEVLEALAVRLGASNLYEDIE